MIKTEILYINEREFTRTYSDNQRYVVRDGVSYEEAIDPIEYNRLYTEGDKILNLASLEDKAEAYDILIGGAQ